jgi:hypothetical protein
LAKKLSEFDKTEQDNLIEELSTVGNAIEEKTDQPSNYLAEALGMCHDCKYCAVTEFEFTGFIAKCNYHEALLNRKDRVVRCNSYFKRGHMTMYDMRDIAYILELDKKKVGFDL